MKEDRMRDMEILKEGDIPYFEELEKEGKAVIIQVDAAALLNLDLSELFPDTEEEALPSDNQVKKWLADHGLIMSDHQAAGQESADGGKKNQGNLHGHGEEASQIRQASLKDLMEAVMAADLNGEDRKIISSALKKHFRPGEILELLDHHLDTETRRTMFLAYENAQEGSKA